MTVREIKVKGEQLSFLAHTDSAEQLVTGATTGATGVAGIVKVKGTYLYWIDNAGDERRIEGTLTGNSRAKGSITVHGEDLYYGDNNGDEHYCREAGILAAIMYEGNVVEQDDTATLSEPCRRQAAKQSDDTLWIVYTKEDGTGTTQIYCASSSDGVSWAEVALTATTEKPQRKPTIAIDSGDVVHVAWIGEADDGDDELFYRYNDGSWQSTVQVTDVSSAKDDPAIAVDSSNNVYVVYVEVISGYYRVRFYNRTAGTFTTVDAVSNKDHVGPSIAIDTSDVIHVVYEEVKTIYGQDYWRLHYQYYDGSWHGYELVHLANSKTRRNACIATDSNDYVHVVWEFLNINYSRRESSSADWANNYVLLFSRVMYLPCISIDQSDDLSVVLHGRRPLGVGVNNIKLKQRISGVWQDEVLITDSEGENINPILTWDASNIPADYDLFWEREAYP